MHCVADQKIHRKLKPRHFSGLTDRAGIPHLQTISHLLHESNYKTLSATRGTANRGENFLHSPGNCHVFSLLEGCGRDYIGGYNPLASGVVTSGPKSLGHQV